MRLFEVNSNMDVYNRGPAALGKYCLKRLPSTCTVVILEQGEIIFDKKGTLGDDMASNALEHPYFIEVSSHKNNGFETLVLIALSFKQNSRQQIPYALCIFIRLVL